MPPPVTAKPKTPQPATKLAVAATRPTLTLPTKKSVVQMRPQDHIMMFFGPPGVGKTTFVNGLADRVLFLSTDRGTRSIETMRVECVTWQKFDEVLKLLESGQSKNYDMVCVDHVDDWANMAEMAVCSRLKVASLSDAGYGKGWSAMRRELMNFMSRLKRLDLGLVFIAHDQDKKVKVAGAEIDKCQPRIGKQAWDILIPLVDVVGYVSMRPVKTQDGKRKEIRTLETTPKQDLYAKDRTRRQRPAKDYELLDPEKFLATFASE